MKQPSRREYLEMLAGVLALSTLQPKIVLGLETRRTEQELWDVQKAFASAALDFWVDLMKLQEGAMNNAALSSTYKGHWLCLIRAVSWVESKHGTVGPNQPARDPMQCGNPGDAWWKSLTHQSGDADRFIGGPGAGNYWAHELPAAASAVASFLANAKLSILSDPNQGHSDTAFNAELSYFWGVPYLVHRVNTRPTNGKTYKCGVYSKSYLVDGAVTYNGGGDPAYRTKLESALAGEIGCSLP